MGRKYLEDIGYPTNDYIEKKSEDIKKKLLEQRETFGFDEVETWDLRKEFFKWLYERVSMYKEIASKHISLEYHKFNYKGEEKTQIELVDRLLEYLEYLLVNKTPSDMEPTDNILENLKRVERTQKDVLEIWNTLFMSMWW